MQPLKNNPLYMFKRHKLTKIFVTRQCIEPPKITHLEQSPRFHDLHLSHDIESVVSLEQALLNQDEFIVHTKYSQPIERSFSAKQDMFQCQTSGSTGEAKFIRRSHASWCHNFTLNQNLFQLSHHDSYALLGHLSHSLSLYAYCEARQIGADIHLISNLRPERQNRYLQAHAITVLYATPTQLKQLVAPAIILPKIRRILCGGGHLTQQLSERLRLYCPNAQITQFYGASETSFVTLSDQNTPEGSVGKPYPNVQIELRNLYNTVGELWVKSPYFFDRYVGKQDQYTTIDATGFMWVGEYARLDEQGYLYLKGRRGRMITVADHTVFLDDIERQLAQIHPCFLVAIKDEVRGEIPIVILQACVDNKKNIARLRQYCRENYTPTLRPKGYIVQDDIPQLPSGKPDYKRLASYAQAFHNLKSRK